MTFGRVTFKQSLEESDSCWEIPWGDMPGRGDGCGEFSDSPVCLRG